MPSNHLILCRPLLLLTSIFPRIRVFYNESALCIRWPKYWSFSFNISPSKELPGLISFRMDWLELLAVQGTLKSLLQHHSSKVSILQHSAFFIVQLSYPYMTTGKTIALTRETFVDKVTPLLFNMLSRLVICNSVTLWMVALQAPQSVGFSRQKYLSMLPCCPPGDLPMSLMLPALAGRFFTTSRTWPDIKHWDNQKQLHIMDILESDHACWWLRR